MAYSFPISPFSFLISQTPVINSVVIELTLIMDDFIPANTAEMLALKSDVINEEVIATAIARVVQMARQQKQSLEQLTESILRDDQVLDPERRKWLSQMITQAWNILPLQEDNSV